MLNAILAGISEKDLNQVVKPLTDVLSVVVPVLLGVVGALGTVWVIILGVKYARAEDPQEHEKARNSLKNAIIGFVFIFVLLVAVQVGVRLFTSWYKNYEYPNF